MSSACFSARRIQTKMVTKVWGREALPPPFEAPARTRIGEIWFEPPPEVPQVLVKYLFTSDKLSVQVHPSDDTKLSWEAAKEECWLVLDAEPDARIAIGFNREVTPEEVAVASTDGSIEKLLAWHSASAGDLFYVPAGTVHAIGPGLGLLEIQQASDTTFRLYDYGRPSELHLERALAVASFGQYDEKNKRSISSAQVLVDGPHFRLDRVEGVPDEKTIAAYAGPLMVLPLEGTVKTHVGEVEARAGECLVAERLDSLDFSAAGVAVLTRKT